MIGRGLREAARQRPLEHVLQRRLLEHRGDALFERRTRERWVAARRHRRGAFPPERVMPAVLSRTKLAWSRDEHRPSPAAGAVAIRLHEAGAELRFEVRDDGVGFDPAAAHDGVGLRNMRDRIDALHGRLEITTEPGRGATVAGAVPVA